MKKLLMMMAALSLLTFGMVSCDRNDDTTDNPTNPTIDNPVQCGETRGEWVDLGLPSGLLWFSANIGAITPEGYGDYFAWGERHVKDTFNWVTYIYGLCIITDSTTSTRLYKYNTSEYYGTIDNKTILESTDDIATAVLDTGARIPTHNEWIEIVDNTTSEWSEQNGVNGWKFTATNGNSIFLPAAGLRTDSSLDGAGLYGNYWSSSLSTEYPGSANGFNFNSTGLNYFGDGRCWGRSVRAVRDSQN